MTAKVLKLLAYLVGRSYVSEQHHVAAVDAESSLRWYMDVIALLRVLLVFHEDASLELGVLYYVAVTNRALNPTWDRRSHLCLVVE